MQGIQDYNKIVTISDKTTQFFFGLAYFLENEFF